MADKTANIKIVMKPELKAEIRFAAEGLGLTMSHYLIMLHKLQLKNLNITQKQG